MTVKTYSAYSMQAAMAQVKEDIGEDALILSTRRIPRPPMDPYGKDTFQIEATRSGADPVKTAPSLSPRTVAASPPVRNDGRPPLTVKTNGHKPPRFPGVGPAPVDPLPGFDLGDLRELLRYTSFNDDVIDLMTGNRAAFKVYSRLLMSGLSEKRVKSLLKKGTDSPDATEDDFTLSVFRGLLSSIDTADPFGGSDARTAAFIGPTGVGKTTTIAKLAAELSMKRKKRVGLVSVDNYRIGALDQLKTYSSIIGLPCIPAFTAADLKKALNKLSSMDYVLIDTAGQSHLDTARMADLKKILGAVPGIVRHLVINASMGRLDMKDVVERFAVLDPSSYVFSKVDETNRCGRIVDQMMDHPMPLSFITNGQEVPEDLIVASPKHVLQLLLSPETFRK
ncbi:flagellar biosynthesis protein FlhF [Desulfatiferula olefinivorans]